MIRKILVPVRGDGKGDNVFTHAAALALGHKAHIVVTHCRPRPQDLMPYGVPIPKFLRDQIVAQSGEVADQEEQVLRAELAALAENLGLVESASKSGDAATVAFVEETGRQVDVIKRHGRLADLIAVAQPDIDRNLGANTLKAALFQSGRPVLMCPPKDASPKVLGQSVAVAWNGSAEAARALAQAMPVILHARTVTLLTNGSDAGPGTTVDDAQEYLGAHGVNAAVERFDAGKSVPKALLATAKALGADMLIMGAYSDSHERETIFGGNTQWIVDKSDLPVLFSH